MRKMFLFMMVSLDGFFEGIDHDLSWHNVDAEFNDFADKQLDETSTLVFGSRTYKMMADFWPSDIAIKTAPNTATRMNSLHKIVFSRTLKKAEWNNSELHNDNTAAVIRNAKKKPGNDIAVLGSSNLCLSLIKESLLDEIRIMVNPVVLGHGTPLFSGINKPLKLELNSKRSFKSGNVLLTYKLYK
ncbi:MAG TPA: dihydrofolate reductase family protein [Candidatus Saccharimonadia bacterium]|nr:dihydrofolate reductase family protein [Candidatus Saccharimonadia bacterium]